jgi:hypothetical protein
MYAVQIKDANSRIVVMVVGVSTLLDDKKLADILVEIV